ncbi:TPA: hypothetical protein QFK82_000188 [Enterococcus faecium]|uniref:hypothetical protein n=1 Tax=Enterococcus TaxID=1350 RepID=UPI001607266D|nr:MULTISPECIES: hypothetical protein [Enterococcus]EGP4988197.1 hypothetical protein [Enterococcus faecium]EME7144773.1 hypothetical protein [Enterococcus faecium]EME8160685.1 hypothetical protein [Enterococcus faecium]EMF0336772.1 hypothetical protein [Enterococcus faecium]MDU0318407.1 hypothetical protein [Enterococcus sp. 2STP]
MKKKAFGVGIVNFLSALFILISKFNHMHPLYIFIIGWLLVNTIFLFTISDKRKFEKD